MRKAEWELCFIIVAIICIHTRASMRSGFIKARVYPVRTNESILAINGKDSVKANYRDGYFGMRVKPGTWKVIVAGEQMKNVVRENLLVSEGQDINLGLIRLTE